MFLTLAKQLPLRGHEVRVVAQNVGDEYLGHKRIFGFDVWYCPWKSAFGHPFPRVADIEEHILWCDIVHTSIFTTSPVVSRLAHKYHKPSLLTIYEVRGFKWFWTDRIDRAALYFAVERYCCSRRFSAYHAISDATLKDIKRYHISKGVARSIYLASDFEQGVGENDASFDMRRYFGIPNECQTFLYFGRPGKTKGINILEKAIRKLAESNINLANVRFCFLLGEEPADLHKAFLKKLERHRLLHLVSVRPPVPREALYACIRQATCAIIPSITEGFGFSALEASLIGTPLIHSDAGSLPEVAFGRCLSFKNRDYKDLAAKIGDVVLRGDTAFQNIPAKNFSVSRMVDEIEALYFEMKSLKEKRVQNMNHGE